jgi:hypothetical protein
MATKILEIKHYGGIEYNEFKDVTACCECKNCNLLMRCLHPNFTHVDPVKQCPGRDIFSFPTIPEWCPLPDKENTK